MNRIDQANDFKIYRQFFEKSCQGAITIDIAGNILFYNNSAEDIFGFNFRELKGYPSILSCMNDMCIKLVHQTEDLSFLNVICTLKPVYNIILKEKKLENNAERFIKINSFPIFFDKNNQETLYQILLICEDFTVQKVSEDSIKKNEEFFKAIFKNVIEPVYILDLSGEIIELNEVAYQQLGYTKDELLNKNIFDIIPPSIKYEIIEQFKSMRENTGLFHLKFTHKNGFIVVADISISNIIYNNKPALLGIAKNIPLRKSKRKKIQKVDFDEKDTDISINHILKKVPQIFKKPIDSIVSYSKTLSGGNSFDGKDRIKLNKINKNSTHLLNLIDELLDYSQLEYSKVPISKDNFNILSFLQSIKETIYSQNLKKGLLIDFNVLFSKDYNICTDSIKLRKILLHLLDNAIKFTNTGKISLTVSKQDKKYLHFSITDSGIGIPEDKKDTIFKPFIQLDNKSKNAEKGIGLGLAIVKRYIKLLGGDICVESHLNVGSSFIFTIKFCNPNLKSKNLKSINRKEYMTDKNNVFDNPRKILLVEDNEDTIILLKIYFSKLNQSISVARNGKEAIEIFNEDKYDLILMDIQVPVMDGLEVTKSIREGSFNNDVPIIATTAFAMKNDREKFLRHGCNEYVSKPIDFVILFSKIQELLK